MGGAAWLERSQQDADSIPGIYGPPVRLKGCPFHLRGDLGDGDGWIKLIPNQILARLQQERKSRVERNKSIKSIKIVQIFLLRKLKSGGQKKIAQQNIIGPSPIGRK